MKQLCLALSLLCSTIDPERFDELFVGDPVQIEANLRELLPRAKERSIQLQILSQIALAQALQKNFSEAHTTLDEAERELKDEDHLARARILLERGRVLWQAGELEGARPLFLRSYELCAAHQFDLHTCNAAHMVAIAAKTPEEKIHWNQLAIDLSERSTQEGAKNWLGSLYNNIGQAYLEALRYSDALGAFQKTLAFREQEGVEVNIFSAKWAIARTLRYLGREEEALGLLFPLQKQIEQRTDLPPLLRGLVYEELAEIYAKKAYRDLSKDEWFQQLEPQRLERLKAYHSKSEEPKG